MGDGAVERAALKIVIAGGGTGGHVQPAIATLEVLRQRVPVEPLWIGSSGGVEAEAAARAQIPFRAIPTGKLRRYVSLHTLVDAVRVPLGVLQALRILRRVRPDVVFATGGFVSVPTVVAARVLGIPCLSHEQTATIGLANRINARFCDVLALAYARPAGPRPGWRARAVVTGNPIRASLLAGSSQTIAEAFGLDPALPLVYVTGGALGAHAINEAVRLALPRLVSMAQVLHQCGPTAANGDYPRLLEARAALAPELQSRYVVVERVGDELPGVYAAATVVVSRAGAGTVAELATLGKPAILIPLPGTGGDEQTRNARVLADDGAATLLPQAELTPDRLVAELQGLLQDPARRAAMSARARAHGHAAAAERLADAILSLAGRPVAAPVGQ